MLLLDLIIFLIAGAVLVYSSSMFVKSVTYVAKFLKMSDFLIAFIVVAFSTSLPELFVGIISAVEKAPVISLGNVIGSNIADVTLVIGIAILVGRGIKITSKTIKRDTFFMLGFAIAPLILMLDKEISRIDGGILLAGFALYIWILLRERKEFHKTSDHVEKISFIRNILFAVLGLGLLFLSAKFVVDYAIVLSIELYLPEIFIGLFLVSIGTSIPEIMVESSAAYRKQGDFAIGDLMGSVVFNSTFVLGVTALISPIEVPFLIFLISAIFLVISTIIFVRIAQTREGFTWKEGIFFIMIYIVFILVEFYFKNNKS